MNGMNYMKHTILFALIGLLLPLIAHAQPSVPMGPFVIANYLNLKGETEYNMMTMAEFNERNKIVRAENTLFTRALKLAEVEWDKGQNALRFPGGYFSAPQVRRLNVYPREKDALKKLADLERKLAEQEAIKERSEESKSNSLKKGSRYGKTEGRSMEDFYAAQRAARDEAYTIVREKMDELLGLGDSAQSRTMRPDDVLNGGRR